MRIDKDKLDNYDKLLRKLADLVQEIGKSQEEMTEREKVLAGAVVVGITSPWNKMNIEGYVGEPSLIASLLNHSVGKFNAIRQGVKSSPVKPSIFSTDNESGEEGNGPN